MLIIDGKGLILGRVASIAAKALLNGEEVHVVNSEELIIQGNKKYIVEKYKARRRLRNKQNPEKSPKWPRVPNLLVRRIIRGMLPRKKASGRSAFKKLRVYIGNPKNLEGKVLDEAKPKHLAKYITIKELCHELGWRG